MTENILYPEASKYQMNPIFTTQKNSFHSTIVRNMN